MHPRIRSADTSVTIAPRLPVNPFGKFGPCSTDLPPPAPSLSSMPTWRATAQNCGVTLRSSGGSEGQEGAGKGWGESLGVWMEGGERHVRCEEFASADYYPEDWILLDEVQGGGANAHTYFPLYPSTHLPAHTRCLSFRWCVRARADARPPHSLHMLRLHWCGQMPASRTPCICSYGAGAGKCKAERSPAAVREGGREREREDRLRERETARARARLRACALDDSSLR